MAKKNKFIPLDAPLLHPDHPRPKTRRDFLRQGFATGVGSVVAPSVLSLLPSTVRAAITPEEQQLCGVGAGSGMIPFICFDLAGGANFAGSNIMVGMQGGQEEFFNQAGYLRMGVLADEDPSLATTTLDETLGLRFHPTSDLLLGINETFTTRDAGTVDGVVIPARSDNDTANNPHNPMYAIARTGLKGDIMTLIGSRNSDSGGNSMAPASLINLEIRPTKIDSPGDARGVVDTGKLFDLLDANQAQKVLEAMYNLSQNKSQIITNVSGIPASGTSLSDAEIIKRAIDCGYIKAVNNAGFTTDSLDPEFGTEIFGATDSIFSTNLPNPNDREFSKTAAVMKLVIDGHSGAGCVTMGGYDYHTGDRTTGDARDRRAGNCIGACLEYAARQGSPVAIYAFSDGSVFSNGMLDPNNNRPVWTGDNSATAASFMLVYNPATGETTETILRSEDDRQIGWFRADGSVDTNSSLCANNVNSLVETVTLNYLALHGQEGNFSSLFPEHGLGSANSMENLIKFNQIKTIIET